MSTFEDIVAGITIDTDAAERENALLLTGQMFFRTCTDDTLHDPVLTHLITALLYASHFTGMTLDEMVPADNFERLYYRLIAELPDLRADHDENEEAGRL